jgi:hypothetical protein
MYLLISQFRFLEFLVAIEPSHSLLTVGYHDLFEKDHYEDFHTKGHFSGYEGRGYFTP